jgi:hypothetical protein
VSAINKTHRSSVTSRSTPDGWEDIDDRWRDEIKKHYSLDQLPSNIKDQLSALDDLDREKVVEILEGQLATACYDDESLDELKDCLLYSICCGDVELQKDY